MLVILLQCLAVASASYCEAPRACRPVALGFCQEGLVSNTFCFEHSFLSLHEQALQHGVDTVARGIWNGGGDDASSWQAAQRTIGGLLDSGDVDPSPACENFYKALYCNSFITALPSSSDGETFSICHSDGQTGIKPCFSSCTDAHRRCGLDLVPAMAVCTTLSTGETAQVAGPFESTCYSVDLSLDVTGRTGDDTAGGPDDSTGGASSTSEHPPSGHASDDGRTSTSASGASGPPTSGYSTSDGPPPMSGGSGDGRTGAGSGHPYSTSGRTGDHGISGTSGSTSDRPHRRPPPPPAPSGGDAVAAQSEADKPEAANSSQDGSPLWMMGFVGLIVVIIVLVVAIKMRTPDAAESVEQEMGVPAPPNRMTPAPAPAVVPPTDDDQALLHALAGGDPKPDTEDMEAPLL